MPKKTDSNQAEIVAALRDLGASVQDLHTVGHGCPDILVGYQGRLWLMEIKAPGGRFTEDEKRWWQNWLGDVAVVRSAEEAVRLLLGQGLN